MKFFTPTQIWHAKRYSRGMSLNALDVLVSLLHIRYLLAPQNQILSSEAAVKSAKYKTPHYNLKLIPKSKHLFDFSKIYVAFGFIIYKQLNGK